jgi:hypothetical protein
VTKGNGAGCRAYRDKVGTVLLCGRVLLHELLQDSDTPPRARMLMLDETLADDVLIDMQADRVVRARVRMRAAGAGQ